MWNRRRDRSQTDQGASVWATRIVCLILFAGFGATGTVAQSPQDLIQSHRYTEAIETLGAEASGERAFWLGEAHRRRADALQDLARLQAQVGAAYYTERDTSEAARSTPWTPYYAVRYQLAVDPSGDALDRLRSLVEEGALPEGYAARAQVWIGRGQHARGDAAMAQKTWASISVSASSPAVHADQAQAHWHVGTPIPEMQCGRASDDDPAAQRCALWHAVRAEDWKRVSTLHTKLRSGDRVPDEIAAFDDFSVRFYDPGTLTALAAADFRAAVAAYKRVTGQQTSNATLLGAIAAVEGHAYDEARTLLQEAPSHPLRRLYRAVLSAETGGNGTEQFEAVRQSTQAGVRAAWAEAAAPYEPQRESVRAYCERQTSDPPENMDVAWRLGRAALALDQPSMAHAMMDAAYPSTQHNNLRAIDPAFLATIAHAKFGVGRRYAPDVLSHLNALTEAYPIVSVVYDLAQGYFVPERREGNVR